MRMGGDQVAAMSSDGGQLQTRVASPPTAASVFGSWRRRIRERRGYQGCETPVEKWDWSLGPFLASTLVPVVAGREQAGIPNHLLAKRIPAGLGFW